MTNSKLNGNTTYPCLVLAQVKGVPGTSKISGIHVWQWNTCKPDYNSSLYCTEVRFASFFFVGFITVIVVNPLERKLAKRTSVYCVHFFACRPYLQCSTIQLQIESSCPALVCSTIRENAVYLVSMGSEVTPLATPFFKGLTKLAILPDYKHPGMLCQALPARRRVRKLDFQSEFSTLKIIWIFLNFFFIEE